MKKLICESPLQLELFQTSPQRPGSARQGRARITSSGKRAYDIPRGYAAQPGTGPAGESCRSCKFRCTVCMGGKNWHKCGLLKHRWTSGPGTDIRLKSPACEHWKLKPLIQP